MKLCFPIVHWNVGPGRPTIHGCASVYAEKVDARLHAQAEHRDGAVEGERQWNPTDKLIDLLWGCDITKGNNEFWPVFLSKIMFFAPPVSFPFIFFNLQLFWGHDKSSTSATYFLDVKHRRRRGVEEFHPDCGKSKTE